MGVRSELAGSLGHRNAATNSAVRCSTERMTARGDPPGLENVRSRHQTGHPLLDRTTVNFRAPKPTSPISGMGRELPAAPADSSPSSGRTDRSPSLTPLSRKPGPRQRKCADLRQRQQRAQHDHRARLPSKKNDAGWLSDDLAGAFHSARLVQRRPSSSAYRVGLDIVLDGLRGGSAGLGAVSHDRKEILGGPRTPLKLEFYGHARHGSCSLRRSRPAPAP